MTDSRLTITRRYEFDAAHRVLGHEGKCKHLHGHRYVLEVTIKGPHLDPVGRVVDFGKLKSLIGMWVDARWDHNLILCQDDPLAPGSLTELGPVVMSTIYAGRQPYILSANPTAENMVAEAYSCLSLLVPEPAVITHLRLYETPNCWADYSVSDTSSR